VGLVLLLAGLTVLWLKGSKQKQFIERLTNIKLFSLVLLAGFGDVLGNVGFLISTRNGALAIAAVLTATILLARIFLKERIALSQSFGIALAIGACALLALG